MEQQTKQKIESWLSGNYDSETKKSIKNLSDDELNESFFKDLEFGTGGLRGIMGVGTNRMNKYTVARATQGFANYLKKAHASNDLGVAIAYDSRNNSKFFAKITANVFSRSGIKVYLFEELRPTPMLSFTVRHLNLQAGVVITASHNPKEYNGYKAYWDDGAQVLPPHDIGIINEVNNITDLSAIPLEGNDELITMIGKDIDKIYLEKVSSLSISKEAIKKFHDLKIVYTPIHGTGITVIPQALKNYGFTNITIIKEQETPDGNFSTVPYPNPEEAATMVLGIKKAKEIDADLILATDPDADRVGIAVKKTDNNYLLLNGNQTGSLLIYYLLNSWKESGKLQGNEYVIKTIVTTELIKSIADSFSVKSFDVLTGFKYIAEKIKENENKTTFIGGGEESYGYLAGEFVRDKDAVIACALIAEALAWAKSKGKTLFELLLQIYSEYGLFFESLTSITKKGISGMEEIQKIMKKFHNDPPSEINGKKIILTKDYQKQIEKELNGNEKKINLPKSNVVQFFLEDGSKITARPSGTEPKIKFYFGVKADLSSPDLYDDTTATLKTKIKEIETAVLR